MEEKDILSLIENDRWMMNALKIANDLNLPDWAIGAGFIRNKVWDHLHGYKKECVDSPDIDLVYYDPKGNDEKADEKLSEALKNKTGLNWEIVNQTYPHLWNNLPPYKSCQDSISTWPETATAIGIKIKDGKLVLIAPHGINDLTNLVIKPTPSFKNKTSKIKERVAKKEWLKKWPKLQLILDN